MAVKGKGEGGAAWPDMHQSKEGQGSHDCSPFAYVG